jgi:hypothetical protein
MSTKMSYIPFFLILFGINSFSQDAVYVRGKGYTGYVFDSSHFIFKSIKDEQNRFTPTLEDVNQAEKILKQQISKTNVSRQNQTRACPVITKKLKKYCRQYFGFIDKHGNKIIWINFFWNRELNNRAKSDLIIVSDGCSYYWNIEVNTTNKSLMNLNVNGIG